MSRTQRVRWIENAYGLVVCVGVILSTAQNSNAQTSGPRALVDPVKMTNATAVRQALGITPTYESAPRLAAVKIAVLDYGFDASTSPPGDLPASTEIVEHYDPDFVRKFDLGDPEFRKPFEPKNRHGRIMARAIWAVTGFRSDGPNLYLLNANGPTMLRRAVRFAIEQRVDIVLFANSFEGGGSGDGAGPINHVVDEALAAKIIWINAAGNYGRRVYHGPIQVLNDGFLKLRNTGDIAALRFRNRAAGNNVNITLTWNDYRDDEDAGTDRDLDIYVEDGAGRRIASGEKVQVTSLSTPPRPEETLNPRERIVLQNLPASLDVPSDPDYGYKIRVKVKRGLFSKNDDVRILVNPDREYYKLAGTNAEREAFVFLDASLNGELYPPADNPGVITVGDSDPASSIGRLGVKRVNHEAIVNDSRAIFSDGETVSGSSVAAAFVTAAVAVLKSAAPVLNTRDVERFAALGPVVPASALKGRPTIVSTSMPFHLWQTPTRAKLVEVISLGK